MFDHCTVKQLKMFLGQFKKYHGIRNYTRMRKPELVEAMDHVASHLEGGSKASGYIQRLEAEKKIIINKMKNPSKNVIKRYGPKMVPDSEYPEYPEYPEYQEPLFAPDEITDYNVGKEKPKKKRNGPKEAEEDRAREKRAEEERKKQARIDHLETLKKQITEAKRKLGLEDQKYRNALKELQGTRMRKAQKDEWQNKIVKKHYSNNQKIYIAYPDLLQYIKLNKLDRKDMNQVYKHVRGQLRVIG